jgi:hypothetical protein
LKRVTDNVAGLDENLFGTKNSSHRKSAIIFQIADLNSVDHRVGLMSGYASQLQTMETIYNQLIS